MCITLGPLLCYRKKAMFVMVLVMFNFFIFFVMFISIYLEAVTVVEIWSDFGFSSNYLVGKGSFVSPYSPDKLVTIFTHMFIHSHNNLLHIIMNMVFLLFLGVPFEEKVGPWVFMAIYFIAGIFGSLFTALFDLAAGAAFGLDPRSFGIGASGAIFGILGAFVATYPQEKIMFPLILIRKWPVWLIAAIYFGIETFIAASSPDDHVGHFAHIGGFIGGLFFIPLVNKFKSAHESGKKLEKLDFTALEPLATNYKLKDMLARIKNEDQKDVQDVWLEEFFKKVRCPECNKRVVRRGHSVRCTCGFKLKF